MTHTKYSNNGVFIIRCLSLPQNLSSSLCQPMAHPTWPTVGAQQEEASVGTPKPTKGLEDHTPRTNALILKLTTGTIVGSAQGGALCCILLWGMGSSFLPVTVPTQSRHRLTSSSHPHTLTSVPWDVTEGSRGHGAPSGQGCQECQARTLHTSSPGFLPAPQGLAFTTAPLQLGVCRGDLSLSTAGWGDE